MPSKNRPATKRKGKIKYIPPRDEMIERYAQSVCKKLDPRGDIPNMGRDFTDFVKAVVRIKTKELNGDDNAF